MFRLKKDVEPEITKEICEWEIDLKRRIGRE